MKENLQQSLKKIKILQDRVDQLCKVKRWHEAIVKAKKLFHLATSFTVILLLNENFELFEELLAVTMKSWDMLMRIHPGNSFNLYWKKQVLAFELLALMLAQKKKFKTGLKAIYEAQAIVSELDETIERNLDYMMAVNTLTGLLLLSIKKPTEALDFILIAERIVYKLVEIHKRENVRQSMADEKSHLITSLEIVGEQQQKHEQETNDAGVIVVGLDDQNPAESPDRHVQTENVLEEQKVPDEATKLHKTAELNQNSADGLQELGSKRSCLSPTLLSNYVLGISLLKNIAMKCSQADDFAENFETYMIQIRQIEQSLLQLGSVDCLGSIRPRGKDSARQGADPEETVADQMLNGVAVSFLIQQHKVEILDNQALSYNDVISETFNKEFMNMIQVCIFVPFLHLETPKPQNVLKVRPLKEHIVPHADLIKAVLNYRTKIGAIQKAKQAQRIERQKLEAEAEVQKQQQLKQQEDNQSQRSESVSGAGKFSIQQSEGPDALGMFDEAVVNQTPQRVVQKQLIFAKTNPKQVEQGIPPPGKPPIRKNQQLYKSQASNNRKKYSDVPQMNDINHFASMVDPRHPSQKRRRASRHTPNISASIGRSSGQGGLNNLLIGKNSPQLAASRQRKMLPHSNAGNSIDTTEPATGISIDLRTSTNLKQQLPRNNISQSSLGGGVRRASPLDPKQKRNSQQYNPRMVSQTIQATPLVRNTTTQQCSKKKSWVQGGHNTALSGAMANAAKTDTFPTLQPIRTVTADAYATNKAQSQHRGVRRHGPISQVGLSVSIKNQNPVEKLVANQKAAEDRMRAFVKGSRQHDVNIERILSCETSQNNEWKSLYQHPKLMGQYYWKDDSIVTNKQRATEIKKVISSTGQEIKPLRGFQQILKIDKRTDGTKSSLLQPIDRKSIQASRQQ